MPQTFSLKNPKYWPLAISFFLGKIIARLPMPFLLMLGRGVGNVSYYFAKNRRHIIERNIAVCFPNYSQKEQKKLVKAHFKALGMGIFEFICAWWKPAKTFNQLLTFEGLEHFEAVQKSGQGALLMTAHFCCLELGARAITTLSPFVAMYRPHKNPYFEQTQYNLRKDQTQNEPINRNEVRTTVKLLRKGKFIWYAPDQNYGGSNHVFVPFFGVKALTITATSTLSEVGNALVLPYYCLRKGNHYHIKFLAPLDNFPSKDHAADCLRLNQLFETWILESPGQYLWAHRRFKSRPEGEPSIY